MDAFPNPTNAYAFHAPGHGLLHKTPQVDGEEKGSAAT